jgi:hypothetical protein
VGYATHFAMRLQLYAFGGGVRELLPPRPVAGGDEAGVWFAGHAAEAEAVMEQKRRFLAEHGSRWPATTSGWEAARGQIGEALEAFPLVAGALLAAGIPPEPGFLGLDAAMLKASLRWANRIRSRYTVLDFLEGQGRLDDTIDGVLLSEPGRTGAA